MKGLKVYPDRMKQNIELTRGLLFSQRVLLALVERGLSRDSAYQIVQRNSMRAWDDGQDFRELVKADPDIAAKLSVEALDDLFGYDYYIRYVDDIFERVGLS